MTSSLICIPDCVSCKGAKTAKKSLCTLCAFARMLTFDCYCDRVPAAETQRHDSASRISSLQLIKNGRQQSRSRLPNRMAQRHRTTIHVNLFRIEPELACHSHCRHRKRFIQLHQINFTRGPSSLLEQLTHSLDRRHHHQARLNARSSLRNDPRHRLDAEFACATQRRHHQRRRSIVNTGRIARSDRSTFTLESRLELCEHFR